MENILQHFTNQPILWGVLLVAAVVIVFSVPYFIEQHKRYGSATKYASKGKKRASVIAVFAVFSVLIYALTPYTEPPTGQIAIVLGNTSNSPAPVLSQDISDAIEATMLQHKGEDKYALIDAIRVVSATKDPEVVQLDVDDLDLRDMGQNSSNAQRSASLNAQAIEDYLLNLLPDSNGANYFEAIKVARDNVEAGSRIIVIGSGLSDSGELNFSHSNILTSESQRKEAIDEVIRSNEGFDFDDYKISFYGLGDSVSPQEALTTTQKSVVRSVYQQIFRSLGADITIYTETLAGESVDTAYVVGTTDTGCGEIGLVFDDDSLKFVSNEATFVDSSAAKNTLATVRALWEKYGDNIVNIQVDGYIAHYGTSDTLSQPRADAVKEALIELGVPGDVISASGKGFGPFEQDSLNRMVKVTISRDGEMCEV